jgi:hypothetical protein
MGICGICGEGVLTMHPHRNWQACFIRPSNTVLWNLVPTCGCNNGEDDEEEDITEQNIHTLVYMLRHHREEAIESLLHIKWYQLNMDYGYAAQRQHEITTPVPYLMAATYLTSDDDTRLSSLIKNMTFEEYHDPRDDDISHGSSGSGSSVTTSTNIPSILSRLRPPPPSSVPASDNTLIAVQQMLARYNTVSLSAGYDLVFASSFL